MGGPHMRILRLQALMLLVLFAVACRAPGEEGNASTGAASPAAATAGGTGAGMHEADVIELPPPSPVVDLSLEEVLAARRSVRDFTPEPLTVQELSQLLWAAQGLTSEWGGRTAPSAGALYPLELYLATPEGLYHYLPEVHRVEILARDDLRSPLAAAALGQAAVADAPAVLIISGVYARTAAKYRGRAERYVQLEAGHAAQNVPLPAVALGLAAGPINAFQDRRAQD